MPPPPPYTHTRIHPLEFPLFLNLFGVPSGRNISVKKQVVTLYSYAEDKKKTSFKKNVKKKKHLADRKSKMTTANNNNNFEDW